MARKSVRDLEKWCLTKRSQVLKVGDFNGDGFTDTLCHQGPGKMKILLNQKDSIKHKCKLIFKNRRGSYTTHVIKHVLHTNVMQNVVISDNNKQFIAV